MFAFFDASNAPVRTRLFVGDRAVKISLDESREEVGQH